MADNNFRPFRNRDTLAREDVDPMNDTARDPLAELARIIGQSNRVNDFDRDPRHNAVQTLDEPLPATTDRDWDDGYAEPDAPEPYPEQHQDQYAEDNYVQPRLPEPYPADRVSGRYDRDDERAPPIASQYSEPAEGYDDPHDDESAYIPRHRDAEPPRPAGRQPASAPQSLVPQSYDDEYEAEDQWDDQADRQSDDSEDYADDATARPRRSGLVMVLAMVGLVMVGAGGAFAYRTMFGGAILAPSLPPVIKANDAPNKIVPNRTDAQAAASNPAGAATPGASDKLVSREEQPVAVQPANAPPRVVSTIPVLPAPGAAPASPPAAGAPALPAVPAQPSAPPKAAGSAQPPAAPLAGSGEPKKVHTVTIRSDQVGNANAAAAAPAPAAPAPAARPRAEAPARATAPKGGGNAPLAIVPVAQGAAPVAEPPRTRVARTEAPSAPVATAPAAAPAAGGYAVQVTSQRSEAEAQSEFKTLQAKFPGQLGNRQPIIHRADLGDKGTFYRALVGPFASSEAAGAMCSNLKAAGGSCIVQKN
jgi:SPOR domain